MRPQQQNRRMRGRNNNGGNTNNNNRKGPNPLTRSYESNGPDVKIRGSAQQIAEKYTTLARDAMSSGDRVMAENYLQHAEHYNRIIAAAQAQMPIQHQNGAREDFSEDGEDEGDEFDAIGLAPSFGGRPREDGQRFNNPPNNGQGGNGGYNQRHQNGGQGQGQGNQGGQPYAQGNGESRSPGERQDRGAERQSDRQDRSSERQQTERAAPVNHADAPQPVIDGVPAEIALNSDGPRTEGREFRDRRERRRDRDRRFERDREASPAASADEAQPELPAFITGVTPASEPPAEAVPAPAAQGAAVADVETAAEVSAEPAPDAAPAETAPRRGRRPRRTARSEDAVPVQDAEPDAATAEG